MEDTMTYLASLPQYSISEAPEKSVGQPRATPKLKALAMLFVRCGQGYRDVVALAYTVPFQSLPDTQWRFEDVEDGRDPRW
jgi:hypothetical protein